MSQSIDTKSKLFLGNKPMQKSSRTDKVLLELNILIVDDDVDDVLILSELFEETFDDLKFKLEHADNYDTALLKLKASHYDLAFFDYRIGHENGLELYRKVLAAGINIPVVFATGQGDENTAVNAMKLGATDYLVKSEINTKSLQNLIYTIFGDKVKAKSQVFMNIQPIQNIHMFFQKLDDNIVPKSKKVFSENSGGKAMIHFFMDFDKKIKL